MLNRKIFGGLAATGVLTVGLVVGGALYAQQSGNAPMGGMMGMMSMMKDCPMHQGMAEGPGKALEHRDELGLSAQQVARLEALEARDSAARGPAMQRMMAVHREIAQASEGERFDEAAARTGFDRMGELHTDMGIAMMRTRHEVRSVLTSEQREKLAELGGMMGMHGMDMEGMMGMMGGMDMSDCPMMQGGMGMEGMQMQRDSAGDMRHQH